MILAYQIVKADCFATPLRSLPFRQRIPRHIELHSIPARRSEQVLRRREKPALDALQKFRLS
jgi:hypothetical protein